MNILLPEEDWKASCGNVGQFQNKLVRTMEGLQYQQVVMRKLAQLQPKKRLIICKDPATAQTHPLIKSTSNLKNMELPQLPRDPLNGHEIIEKQIKTHQELVEPRTGLSLSKQKKENIIGVAERKKSVSNGNFTTQNTIQTRKSMRVKSKDSVFDGLVASLIEKMKQKAASFVSHEQFSVNKGVLQEVLTQLIRMLASPDLGHLHAEHSSMKELQTLMQEIQLHTLLLLNQSKKNRLKLHPNFHSIAVTHLDYHSQQQSRTLELSNYEQKASQFKKQIERLTVLRQNLVEHNELLKAKLIQEQQLEKHIESLTGRIEALEMEEKEKRVRVILLDQEVKRIENFVNVQQNRQLLKLASQDYKEIQADIYEYAVYLQSNQLASSLTYQPLPFDQLQAQITEEIKQISNSSTKNSLSSKSQEENCLVRTMEFYRKKDRQMQKMLEFKTKCIRQYVSNMKKWLQNWELKQQFLVNLRKEFASLSRKMTQQMQTTCQQLCSTCSVGLSHNIRELAQIFENIEENYCLGNSFY